MGWSSRAVADLRNGPGTRRQAVTEADLLADSPRAAWRVPDPQDLLYLERQQDQGVIERASHALPPHPANLRALAPARAR